jgi:hypothetical protein
MTGLATPNTRDCEIFPVWMLSAGDDGKRKPFHVVHCLAQPKCEATLRISPGRHSRLPPECIVKFAAQKDWFADRKGYALCPLHKPGQRPSAMPPGQKRAAFLAIRDRNMAAAQFSAAPAEPVGALAKKTAKIRAALGVAAARGSPGSGRRAPLRDRIMAFIAERPATIWNSRREAAAAAGVNMWTFNEALRRAIDAGLVVQEPMSGHAFRPFRLRLVDRFDPPAIQPEEEPAMIETADAPPDRLIAEPPRQPTREDNRRIRDFLDANFDDDAARWSGDWSDEQAAVRLHVPRAWVSALRSALYGDDTNETSVKANQLASELVADAVQLKDDALSVATRAEELERRCRQFLAGGKRS